MGKHPYVVVLTMALVVAGCSNSSAPTVSAPTLDPMVGTWGVDTSDMDATVRPGDDFYDYVVGSWIERTDIPDTDTCAGVLEDINAQVTTDVVDIVATAESEQAAAGAPAQQISDLYASYMGMTKLDELGLQPVRPYLAAVDAVADRSGLNAVLAQFARRFALVADPFSIDVWVDPHTPTRYLPEYWQGGLSLDDRSYYLDQDPDSVDIRGEFVAHVERMLALAGYPDSAAQAQRVLAVETKVAEAHWPLEDTADVERTSTVMNRREVERLGAGAPLKEMFDAYGLPAGTDFIVGMPDVLEKSARLYATEPLEDWTSYFRYQVLKGYGDYLAKPFADEMFSFYDGVLTGTEAPLPRGVDATDFVSDQLSDLVGQRYVERHFTDAAKDQVLAMADDVIAAYGAMFDRTDRMSDSTRAQAQAKLAAMQEKIGFPEDWTSYPAVIRRDDLIGNVDRLNAYWWKREVAKLSQPIDRSEWDLPAQESNAQYSSELNDITMTAAFLQPPFLDLNADAAANYGATAWTIGHEISHGFDSQGRRYDSANVLRDWWAPNDAERFERESARLTAQFDQYEPIPGERINGELTLGENIADLVGLEVAYDAYHRSLNGVEAPVIDGLTGDQRFFIAYAASWKQKCRDEYAHDLLATDYHSPPKYRINGIVRNMDEWYTAFDIKEGDDLYLPQEDRVKMW